MHIHAPFSRNTNSILCQLQLPFGVVFYDSMPSDEDYYEGGSYAYGGQYYPATQGCDPCPAGIAHEMLHAFGAPDFYCQFHKFLNLSFFSLKKKWQMPRHLP